MKKIAVLAGVVLAGVAGFGKGWEGFERGIGIGGWLTNYKRFNVLPQEKRLAITEGDLEHFDTYITEGDVERIKRWGFDHIRLGFDQIVLEEAPGKWRERTFGRIDAFIGWCAKHKINAVLNLHKAVGNYCDIEESVKLLDDEKLQDRFVALWLEMERRYAKHPGLAFEILNEVRDVKPELWNRLADRTLRAIREKNPGRWVVIGSTCWGSAHTLGKLKLWDDERVVYTFHNYEPFMFTHQRGVLQSGPLYVNKAEAYPGRAAVEKSLAPAVAWAKANPGKILWNGEFGTIRHMNPISRVRFMRDNIQVCKAAGIPYCVWNYLSTPNDGNRFSLVDDETRDFLSDELLRACLGESEEERGLKFMSFNIWGDYFGNPPCERDLKQARYLKRTAPDVVAMQEVTPAFWKSRLFRELREDYGVVRSEGNPRTEYNPVLWRKDRLELVEGGVQTFAAADNPEGTKGFGWAVLREKATGKKLIAYSAHLWWKTAEGEEGAKHDAARVRNAKELLARLGELRARHGGAPVVGGGDLNSTVKARKAGRESPLAAWEAEGYLDAQYAVKGASGYSTHHGNPRRDGLGNLRGRLRAGAEDAENSLDHVHYTPQGVEAMGLEVDRSQDVLETTDHATVIFTFRLSGGCGMGGNGL